MCIFVLFYISRNKRKRNFGNFAILCETIQVCLRVVFREYQEGSIQLKALEFKKREKNASLKFENEFPFYIVQYLYQLVLNDDQYYYSSFR